MKSFLNGKFGCQSSPERPSAPASLGPVSIIDPSLFTAPYDAGLVGALRSAGVDAELVGRPLRPGEPSPGVPYRPACYRRFGDAPGRFGAFGTALKAAEHLCDGLAPGLSAGASLLHFQWLPFPLADALFIRLRRRRVPVVVTVHDTTPFNGNPSHPLQVRGFRLALKGADRLIVHTASGRDRLAALGITPDRIAVVPHGPLGGGGPSRNRPPGERLTLVAFGKIRPYKGLDILLEALTRLDADTRSRLRVVIAGEPMMDLAPLRRAIARGGLGETVDLVARRLDQAETEVLLHAADAFVFPYREIEASGVFYLVQWLGRWIIASRLGAFAEAIEDGAAGRLVAPEDPDALAAALREAAVARPRPSAAPRVAGWDAIARATIGVYAAARHDWATGPRAVGAAALAGR